MEYISFAFFSLSNKLIILYIKFLSFSWFDWHVFNHITTNNNTFNSLYRKLIYDDSGDDNYNDDEYERNKNY